MLSQQQIAYELDYWRQTDRAKNDARQRRILDLWGFTGAPSVLEVGTGPWGGCLPFVEAEVKYGIDPGYLDFDNAGFLEHPEGCTLRCQDVESAGRDCDEVFDAVLCCNTLDHGDSDFRAIDSIARLLKPSGKFYLHVNLRTPEQLNEGHDHCLHVSDLHNAAERNGLRPVRFKLYDHDPVEWAPYQTVVAVWQKSS